MKTDPLRNKIRWSHPSGMVYEENYFVLEMLDFTGDSNTDPLIIESKYNKKYEDIFREYWAKLKGQTYELSVNDKYTISEIIYHLKLRTKDTRQFFFSKDASETLVEETGNEMFYTLWSERKDIYEQYGLNFSEFSKLMKMFIETNYAEKDKRKLHNNFLHFISTNEDSESKKQMLWKLVQSPWIMLHSDIKSSFVTTDNPGASIENKEIFNFLGDNKFDFYFPISRYDVLKIECRNKEVDEDVLYKLQHQYPNSAEINDINLYFSINASDEIYGYSDEVLKYAKQNLGDRTKYSRKNMNFSQLYEKYKLRL